MCVFVRAHMHKYPHTLKHTCPFLFVRIRDRYMKWVFVFVGLVLNHGKYRKHSTMKEVLFQDF